MDDGRQRVEDELRVAPRETEVAACEEEYGVARVFGNPANMPLRTQDGEVDRRAGEVGRQAERETARQEEAVPRAQRNRIARPFDDEPALAGEEGVALD